MRGEHGNGPLLPSTLRGGAAVPRVGHEVEGGLAVGVHRAEDRIRAKVEEEEDGPRPDGAHGGELVAGEAEEASPEHLGSRLARAEEEVARRELARIVVDVPRLGSTSRCSKRSHTFERLSLDLSSESTSGEARG